MNNKNNNSSKLSEEIKFSSDKEMMEYVNSWKGDEQVDYQKENPEDW